MIQAAESGLPVDMSQVVYNTSIYINICMNNIKTCKYVHVQHLMLYLVGIYFNNEFGCKPVNQHLRHRKLDYCKFPFKHLELIFT